MRVFAKGNSGKDVGRMKLYWRYKKNGSWTWKPAVDVGKDDEGFICVIPEEEEE